LAYGSIEGSTDLGQPAGLVEFSYGTTQTTFIRYTDQEVPVTFQGQTFAPIPFESADIKATGRPDKTSFSFKLPASAEICKLYYQRPPNTPVAMVIYQGHREDNYQVVWSGRVQSVLFSGVTATLTCEPATISLQRTGLRMHWQTPCPHVLYGASCRATQTWVPFTISNKAQYQLFVNEVISNPTRYIGGMARWAVPDGYAYGAILRADAALGRFDLGRSTELIGPTVEVSVGCDKSLGYCNTVFSNGVNYGGTPYIPLKNPLNRSVKI